MTLVVPEYFLENYCCDSCGKFLSVLPVKIHYNRKLTCGRCVKSEDDGTDSIFNNLVKLSLFKCINRFDGCRMLLTSTEVVKHEDICRSKVYRCPLCPADVNIATYNFPQHFEHNHPKNILLHSHLMVEMRDSLPEVVYLYRLEDNLFLVTVNNDTANDFITFNVKCLKRETDGSTHKFHIEYGKETLKTEKRLIRPLECEDDGYLFPKSKFSPESVLSVILDLNLQPSITIIDKTIVNETNILSEIGEPGVEDNSSNMAQKLCIKYKKEILPDKNEIIPYCYLCSKVLRRYFKFDCNVNPVYFLCEDCEQYARIIWNTETFKEFKYKNILHYCYWGCGLKCDSHELQEHEINCPSQPSRNCPIEDCEFLGNLLQILLHFDHKHKRKFSRIDICPTNVWMFGYNGIYESYLWRRDNFVLIRTWEWYDPFDNCQYITIFESKVCRTNHSNLEIVAYGLLDYDNDNVLLINIGENIYQSITQDGKITFKKQDDRLLFKVQENNFFIKCITQGRLGTSNFL